MARTQDRAKRKISGGVYQRPTKVVSRLARASTLTKLGSKKEKTIRIRSGRQKNTLLSIDKINVFDPKAKKHKVTEIKTVVETPSNRHFVRRNIITKGTIIETQLGKVKVTSRPGQEGTLNGILV